MRAFLSSLILALSFLSWPPAAGADMGAAAPAEDPALEAYRDAAARADWPAATRGLKEALSRDPGNAEYHNLYAYSLRHGPNPDMVLVFKHYNEALRLDPKHRGAHEYIGEAYLMVGDVAKAKEHLAALDRLCFFSCAEHRDLKKAISAYEAVPR